MLWSGFHCDVSLEKKHIKDGDEFRTKTKKAIEAIEMYYLFSWILIRADS